MLLTAAQLFMSCLGLMMFTSGMKRKLAIFILAALCLTCVQLPLPFAKGAFGFLPFCFLLSILSHFGKYYVQMKHTIVFKLMMMMIVSAVIFAFTSPHYNSVFQKGKLIYNELMQKTFIMAFVMFCIWKPKDLKPAMKWALIGLLFITVLGVVNYIERGSFWVNAMKEGGYDGNEGFKYAQSDRFRVQSTFGLAFDYGYTCILFALLFFFARKKNLVAKSIFWVAEACCLFGIYTCGCRTVHVAFLLAIMVYGISAFDMRKWIFAAVIALIIGVIVVTRVPAFQEYMDLFKEALNVSTKRSNMKGGSTIGMRIVQLFTVFSYLKGHMLFGRGKDFFLIDLGWEKKNGRRSS